jgi:MATE family multidrug resistance protein
MNVACQTINYGLATGQETVVSQANGARRYREVGVCLQRGLIVLLISQFVMSGASYFGTELLTGLGQDPELASMAGKYIWLSVPTMWGSGFSTVMCTWLQAQDIFAPVVALGLPGLAVQIAGLRYALPRYGYLGAAAATAASSWTSAALFTCYAVHLERVKRAGERRTLRLAPEVGVLGTLREAWSGVGGYLTVALPSFSMILFEWSALEVAVLYSGVLPDSAGGVPTAVSAMVMGAITCCYAWSLALSQVASSRVGNTLGAGDGRSARFRAFCAWSLQLCFALACQAVLYVHRNDWAEVFAGRGEVEVFAASTRCSRPFCFATPTPRSSRV